MQMHRLRLWPSSSLSRWAKGTSSLIVTISRALEDAVLLEPFRRLRAIIGFSLSGGPYVT